MREKEETLRLQKIEKMSELDRLTGRVEQQVKVLGGLSKEIQVQDDRIEKQERQLRESN